MPSQRYTRHMVFPEKYRFFYLHESQSDKSLRMPRPPQPGAAELFKFQGIARIFCIIAKAEFSGNPFKQSAACEKWQLQGISCFPFVVLQFIGFYRPCWYCLQPV